MPSFIHRKPRPSPLSLHHSNIPKSTPTPAPSSAASSYYSLPPSKSPTSWPAIPPSAPPASTWTPIRPSFNLFTTPIAETPSSAASFAAHSLLASTFDGPRGDCNVRLGTVPSRQPRNSWSIDAIMAPVSCTASPAYVSPLEQFPPIHQSGDVAQSSEGAGRPWKEFLADYSVAYEGFIREYLHSPIVIVSPASIESWTTDQGEPLERFTTPLFPFSSPASTAVDSQQNSPYPYSGSDIGPLTRITFISTSSYDSLNSDASLTSFGPPPTGAPPSLPSPLPTLQREPPPIFTNPFAPTPRSATSMAAIHHPLPLSPRQIDSPTLLRPGPSFSNHTGIRRRPANPRRLRRPRPTAIYAPALYGYYGESFFSPEQAAIAVSNFEQVMTPREQMDKEDAETGKKKRSFSFSEGTGQGEEKQLTNCEGNKANVGGVNSKASRKFLRFRHSVSISPVADSNKIT